MVRTISATYFAAASVLLTAPSAFSQTSSSIWSEAETRLELDAGLVALVREGGDSDVLADLEARWSVEMLTENGRRFGLVLGGRIERDSGREAWGNRLGDCPAGIADCANLQIDGVDRALRGTASGLFSEGDASDRGAVSALEAGYVYVHSGWGEWRLGAGPGAADIDAVRGPTAFRLSRADGGRVDLTGLSAARTRNLSSGFDPKLVFRSIALGQLRTIGTFRASISFTPEIDMCGVDHCAGDFGSIDPVTPPVEDVIEAGLHYALRRGDHDFAFSAGVSRGSDASGHAGIDALRAEDAGLSWQSGRWRAGARWYRSNQALSADGNYEALAVSAGYEAGDWLTTLEWANFSDDLVHASGESWQMSTSKLIGDHWVAGAGLQFSERSAAVIEPAGRRGLGEDETALFIELGWRY
ncbi:hypothetical protein [Maricaulis sp.]|uniref:hypothetical protein n=1 Tax=Maricaulis sp. TaxID=1486257 RepID=UPI002631B961|nr:hypothetical protein [Maricaulis sp.]